MFPFDFRKTIGVWSTFIIAMSANCVLAQNATIEGKTWEWLGGAQYQKLPGVIATVTRGGNFVTEAKSKDNGNVADYKLQISSGEPVNVVFHLGEGYVPEVQSLAAGMGELHNVSPALVKVKQYEAYRMENKSMPSIREKIQTALMALGPDVDNSARRSLTEMLRRFPK